jgi:hypothetical protein
MLLLQYNQLAYEHGLIFPLIPDGTTAVNIFRTLV